ACRTSAGARCAQPSWCFAPPSPRRSSSSTAARGSLASRCRSTSTSSTSCRATRSGRSSRASCATRSQRDRHRHQHRRPAAVATRARYAAAPARRGRARLRRARVPRRLDGQDHGGRGGCAGHLLPLLRLEEGDLRRAGARSQPARAARDEGRLDARPHPARGGAQRLPRLLRLHRCPPRAVPHHPSGRVRLARDAALPLRAPRAGVRRGTHGGEAGRRGRRARSGGDGVGPDGSRRADRSPLDPLVTGAGAPAGRLGRARADHQGRARGGTLRRVGLAATASYLPERRFDAAELAAASAIPREVVLEKFGLREKRIAADGEHVTDLAVEAARRLFDESGVEPADVDVVMYFGSSWKDWAVWQAAPWIAHRLGCSNAFAVEYDNVSHGSPIALRIAGSLLRGEPGLRNVLLVAACRESRLLDYANERSRFMFNFGDGAVAALLVAEPERNEVLGCHGITDGSFSLQVKVPSGGSVSPNGGYRFLDVADPVQMKDGLDRVSLANFAAAARGALERSGASLGDVGYLCGIHMKPSMHRALVAELGLPVDRAAYLDDTGHMSGVDPLLALDRAARAGELRDGELVLLLAAGTGYTWAASVVRWGP